MVNAADNKQRDKKMDTIKIDIKPEEGMIRVSGIINLANERISRIMFKLTSDQYVQQSFNIYLIGVQ